MDTAETYVLDDLLDSNDLDKLTIRKPKSLDNATPEEWDKAAKVSCGLTDLLKEQDKLLTALDKQEGGSHYKNMQIQPMQYSMANGLDACQHTIIKYVSRFRDKGGLEDLKKARHCIDMLIEFEG